MAERIKCRSPQQIEQKLRLEEKAWDLYVKGLTSRQIGEEVGMSCSWAQNVVARTFAERTKAQELSVRGHLDKLLREVNLVRQAAWSAWEKSKEDKVTILEESGETHNGDNSKRSVKTEGQAGDAVFLRTILECNKRESALRGIEKPVQPIFQFLQAHVDLDTLIIQMEQQITDEANIEIDPDEMKVLENGSQSDTDPDSEADFAGDQDEPE